MPCTEPIAFHVVDVAGATLDVCVGHAIEVRARMEGAVVTPLERL